jgi:hypothetical protein
MHVRMFELGKVGKAMRKSNLRSWGVPKAKGREAWYLWFWASLKLVCLNHSSLDLAGWQQGANNFAIVLILPFRWHPLEAFNDGAIKFTYRMIVGLWLHHFHWVFMYLFLFFTLCPFTLLMFSFRSNFFTLSSYSLFGLTQPHWNLI